MKRVLVFIICWLLSTAFVMAQQQVETLNRIKMQYQQAANDTLRLDFLFQLANGYRFSNIDSSLFYADVGIALADSINHMQFKARLMSLKGATLLESGRLPESMKYQFDAMNLAVKIKDEHTRAFALNRIGNAYMELADFKKANDYYFLSAEKFHNLGDSGLFYNELSNIGNVFELMKIPDSALHYQNIVYRASLRIRDRHAITRPEMMFRLGNAYVLNGNQQEALKSYKAGIAEALFDNDIRNLTMNNLFLAKLYKEMKLPDSSHKYAQNAIRTGNEISFRKGVYEASLVISDLFKTEKKYDSAYEYLVKANAEKDSLTGTLRIQELQRIQLDEQQRQREEDERRVSYQNKQKQFILLAGIGVFLVIATILYRNNKQKVKANAVLEETLSNLKSTQSQLIQSEKMASLGELTAGIAHEIQNPLNFVNNFSEVNTELIDEMQEDIKSGRVKEAIVLADNIKDNQEKITHHGKRADAIVKGMLQHSRSSSGVKEPTAINKLADEYLRLAYHGLRAKDKSFNATFKTDFDESIGSIMIIPQDIGRVLLNLITNAFYAVTEKRKFNGDSFEPTVILKTKKINGDVEIMVKDNGTGIPQNVIDKIFQPFFTTKPTGQGTGLGLSMSYDIIKAHGGELKVESKEPDGTSFIIHLPTRLT